VLFRSKTVEQPSGESPDSVSRDVRFSSPDLSAIWNELMGLKDLVENEHDRKLRRIESDLRWTMMLVGAQFMTIIGSAIATLVGG
jgi:hypothetical protein